MQNPRDSRDICRCKFMKKISTYYKKYEASSYYPGYCCLVARLSQKGAQEGALDKEDLLAIMNWGVQRGHTVATLGSP